MANKAQVTYRKDYQAPNHDIDNVILTFDLIANRTRVTSTLTVTPRSQRISNDLVLDGENLHLDSLKINGKPAVMGEYDMLPGQLIFHDIADITKIEIVTIINPEANLEFSGLYMSNGNFLTQCEAEGFRRITYFPDRPDVLSKYTVYLHAPKACKVLLSNGNLIEEGELPDGRKYACWEDPHPKPSYLFALVAGNFVADEAKISLMNGKTATLQVWVEPGNENKTAYAMESLKKAIKWDESRFGLTLDLDRFMIVATDDFNMGAMENKGLNIFNSKYVLADEQVATDSDFSAIQSTVGHEYFHNWTGNRVTCRDWFQLSLKEGLTVFREQEFASDCLGTESAKVVNRLRDVRALKVNQFPEDAGPMAHPIRPDSYREINNFYTMTVYEKGAEVVRMYQTLLGKEGFKKGLLEYLNRFDGCAATCDDFRVAMGDANDTNLIDFSYWYSQAGTPRVKIRTEWQESQNKYIFTATQSNRSFTGQPKPHPLPIPIAMGILDDRGRSVPLQLIGEDSPKGISRVLLLTEEEQSWTFVNIPRQPIPSIGRGFSAPVIFDVKYDRDQLILLAKNDPDLFNRAQAFEKLSLLVIEDIMNDIRSGKIPSSLNVMEKYVLLFDDILNDESLSPAYRAEVLRLPSETNIAEQCIFIEPAVIREALTVIQKKIGQRLKTSFEEKLKSCDTPGEYRFSAEQAGKRALKHLSLEYLVISNNPKATLQMRTLFNQGNNLTDRLAAIRIAAISGLPIIREMLLQAVREWTDEPLLFNKLLQTCASLRTISEDAPVVDTIRQIMSWHLFSLKNPNKVYSLLGTFFRTGGPEFHTPNGKGYQLWCDAILKIDKFNPQVAARLARSIENWRRYEPKLSFMMYRALVYVSQQKGLSVNLREIIDKSLNEPV